MRKALCGLLVVILVLSSFVSAFADTEWAKQNLPSDRQPEYIELVPWDELPPDNPDQHHYLLLVLDQKKRDPRPDDAKNPSEEAGHRKDIYGNTDGIVILTLDTRAKRIMLTSIIRDAIVAKPNSTDTLQKHGRINYIYNDFGPEALCKVISEHLGFRIEKYIMFTFFQVRDIVKYMGGVDVELKKADIDYLRDAYEVSPGWVVSADGQHDVARDRKAPEGIYHLQPWAAVLYMRIRKNDSKGDLMRTQRARNVLSALADKCRLFTWDDCVALANNLAKNNNKTNMSPEDMIEAAGYAWDLRNETIEERRVPEDEDVRAIHFADMAAKEINWVNARQKIQEFLHYNFLVLDEDDED